MTDNSKDNIIEKIEEVVAKAENPSESYDVSEIVRTTVDEVLNDRLKVSTNMDFILSKVFENLKISGK